MTEEIRLPVLSIKDGNVVANSRDVADYFEKAHFHILRDVRQLIAETGDWGQSNFGLFKIKDLTGESISHCEMTKDGFTLLAMGFTGERALKFKIAYIERFNAMEEELRARQVPVPYVPVPDSAEMEFIRLAKQVKGERFASALWDQMGIYCPPGFEPGAQGCLFSPANQNISISITRAA